MTQWDFENDFERFERVFDRLEEPCALGLVVGGGLRIDTDRLIKLQWDKVQNNSPSLSG